MGQAVLWIEGLPPGPLDAAAAFHTRYLIEARTAVADSDALALIFPAAGHEHRAWRLAAVQELAREAAPKRVNAVSGDDGEAIEQTLAWLAQSAGITGQMLAVDGNGGKMA